MKNTRKMHRLVFASLIAAIYVLLTYIVHILGLDRGAIQIRISEALAALLYFTPVAIPGLFVGCLLSNLLTGCMILDVVFGSLATLLGAILGYALRKNKIMVLLPTIISNSVIIPLVLRYTYSLDGALWYFIITVGVGEIISCGVLGYILINSLEKNAKYIF